MKHHNILCLLIVFIFIFSGCAQKSSTDKSNDKANAQHTSDNQNIEATENATETASIKNYVKQGFFTVSDEQADEIIYAVMNNKSVWREDLEHDEIYYLEFADLNFDGKIEFIVCDTLYDDKAEFHSNAYYLKDGQLEKVEIIDNINPMNGFNDDYTAYFDKQNGEYVVIGDNVQSGDDYSYDTYYKLIFDGQKITYEYLLGQRNTSSINPSNGEKQYEHTYYKYDNETPIEISESEHKAALRNIEENDDWIEIITNPSKLRDVDYSTWEGKSSSEQERRLREVLPELTYDIYVPEE